MTRFVVLGVAFLGALAFAVPAEAQSTTVKFQKDKNGYTGVMDTYIDQFVDDWYGNENRIEIRHWDDGAGVVEKMKVLISFDVTTLPTDATVTSAKLTLYSLRARGQNGDVPTVEKVTSTWDNKTTWNMAPSYVAASATCPPVPNGNGTGTPYTDDPTPGTEVYVISGLESLVQGWIAAPASNFGMQISCTSNLNFKWASSEYPDAATYSPYRPELEVTFTTPAPIPPPTLTVNPVTTPAASSPIAVSGTASATTPATLTQVTWENVTSGATGTASGTSTWSANVPLITGSNLIRITATDSFGHSTSSQFSVVLPNTKGAPKSHKLCGLGVAGSPGSFGVAALGIALLVLAVTRRGR